MQKDKGLTAVQAYLRAKAREAQQLFCTVCRLAPPRFRGGVCDDCERELGAG